MAGIMSCIFHEIFMRLLLDMCAVFYSTNLLYLNLQHEIIVVAKTKEFFETNPS